MRLEDFPNYLPRFKKYKEGEYPIIEVAEFQVEDEHSPRLAYVIGIIENENSNSLLWSQFRTSKWEPFVRGQEIIEKVNGYETMKRIS